MNIYVGNLSHDVSDDELKEAFEAYGNVESAKVIRDRFSGESRGFGFVEMQNKAEAQEAMSNLDGKEIKGRFLIVNEARPKSDNRRRGAGGNRGHGGGGRRRY